jgi:hypothetical protein
MQSIQSLQCFFAIADDWQKTNFPDEVIKLIKNSFPAKFSQKVYVVVYDYCYQMILLTFKDNRSVLIMNLSSNISRQ